MNEHSEVEDRLLRPEEAAAKLSISPETLATWRCTKKQHVPFVKVGAAVRYRTQDITAYVESRLQPA